MDGNLQEHGRLEAPAPAEPQGVPAAPAAFHGERAQVANPTGSTGGAWLQQRERGALTEQQSRQLDALFGQILPADPSRGTPGAVDAGASRFLSALLAADASVYEEVPDWQARYPVWLSALDLHVRSSQGRPLAELAPEAIVALLAGLEAGTVQGLDPAVDQKLAFRTLYRHCIQGCFSDPRWGGNRDRIMWRWIGYPHAPEEGR
jgi:hypothetical protein